MRYLLDTNTCILAMRGKQSVVLRMAAVSPSEIAVSSVTCYELYTGVEKCANPQRERTKVELFISAIVHASFDNQAATHAASLRAVLESQGQMIGPYDVLIAGHATALGLTIVTSNTSEFARIPGLPIENWNA